MRKSSMIDLAKKYEIHIILFVIAVVTYLPINYTHTLGCDDYYFFSGAVSILQNHTYLINGHPTKYPVGYSLLIVPFIYLFGKSVQSAIYPCTVLGALSVVILYEFTKDLLNDKRAALFASLFLIFSYHWLLSMNVGSDVPALFFMLLAIFCTVKYAKTEKSIFVYLFYFAAGFACLIRYDSALVFVIVGLYLLLSNKTHLLKQKEVWLGIPLFFVILSPQMIHNHVYFGSLFTTGYSQEYHTYGQLFSLEHFFTSGDFHPKFQIIGYIKSCIIGFGTPIFPFFLYGLWDWIKQRKREELSLILPWIAVTIVTFSFYFYHSTFRHIILIFPALLILSGHGFSKMCDTSIIKTKTIKRILIVLLLVILLIPTAMFWLDYTQEREACRGCGRETFVWVHDNSGEDDIIISQYSPGYAYYSQRKIYSLQTSREELERLIHTHNNTYLVIDDAWGRQSFRRYMIKTEQWLNETYGLTHLKTIESEPRLYLTSKLLYNIKSKVGISPYPAKDRWDVYLIGK